MAQIPSDVTNLLSTILFFFVVIVLVACVTAFAILYVLATAPYADHEKKKEKVQQRGLRAKGPVVHCKVCGQENPIDANFCQKCGQALR